MGLSTNILLVVQRIAAEFKAIRSDIASGSTAIQGEIDALSDVVATKATESNVNNQLAQKADASDLDNVFGIATAAIPSSQKGAVNGVATLGSDSKLVASQLPSLAITEFLGSSSDQASMLAKTGQQGDWTTRTDRSTVWIITGADPSQLSSWTEMLYPTAPVTSVAGRTGAVVLSKSDVGLANVDNTSDANKPVSTPQQTALDAKAPLVSPTFTGTPTAPTAATSTNTTQVATTQFVKSAMGDYWTSNVATGSVVFVNSLAELPAGTPVDSLVVVRAAN